MTIQQRKLEQMKCVKTIGIAQVTLEASTPFVPITVQDCETVSDRTILLLWPSYTQ